MPKPCPANERIKHAYFAYLREAKGRSEQTVDAVAKSIARFEAFTAGRDFKRLHVNQIIAFKRALTTERNRRTGAPISLSTSRATLAALNAFFLWLADQEGYRSKLRYSDAAYFSLSENEARASKGSVEKAFPTLDQIHLALSRMPAGTDIERRDRALVALIALTGARDGAVIGLKLKHLDLQARRLDQVGSEIGTKFGNTFSTFFCPIGGQAEEIVADWVARLRALQWGDHDPLFPAPMMQIGPDGGFRAGGLVRAHWSTAAPIRHVFRRAFTSVGLPAFTPHRFRDTLVQLGQRLCTTPEEFKAWSQNIGHKGVLVTLTSYGQVATYRQGELIREIGARREGKAETLTAAEIEAARRFLDKMARNAA